MDATEASDRFRRNARAGIEIKELTAKGVDYRDAYRRMWARIMEEDRAHAAGKRASHERAPVQSQGFQACCLRMKGKPCPHEGNRWVEGRAYCHYHDPRGKFRQNLLKSKKRALAAANHKAAALTPSESRQCSHLTDKGFPCRIPGERIGPDGLPVCHFHDPNGVHQKQVRGELPWHRAEVEKPAPEPVTVPAQEWPSTIDPNWHRDDGCPFEPGKFGVLID